MEQARYEVRTPMWLWVSNGLLSAFALLVGGGAVLYEGRIPGPIVLLAVILATTTVAFWFAMSAYRVGGGRNLIRIYPERVEVPHVTRRQPMVFGREGLTIDIRDVIVRYRLGLVSGTADVRRGKLITLSNAQSSRKLSTLTLTQSDDERALVADLQRFSTGQPALGREGHVALVAPRTDYDDRLDRELAQLE